MASAACATAARGCCCGVEAAPWRSALRACLSSAASTSGRYGQPAGDGARIVRVDRSGLLGRQARLRRAAELGREEAGRVLERARVEREESTPLAEHLKALIRVRGPISVSTFMSEALTNPVRPPPAPRPPAVAQPRRRSVAHAPRRLCSPGRPGGRVLHDARERRRVRVGGRLCDGAGD